MSKKVLCFLLVLVIFSCTKRVDYKGNEYTIEDSEFGVAFIDKYNSIAYYLEETVYENKSGGFYCKISESSSNKEWVVLEGKEMKLVDSVSIDFASCKPLHKKVLIE